MKKSFILTILVILASGAYVRAAVLVVSVKGEAAYQAGSQWKPLMKGQTIAEGTRVSTGVNSLAVLNIDGSMVTVKPMTSIKIYRNMADSASRETSLGLQYGAVKAKIDKTAKVRTRFNITTPVATSSVRGTEELVSYGPSKGMTVRVLEGIIGAFNREGVSNTVSGRQTFNLRSDESRSGDLLRDVKTSALVDVIAGAVTADEAAFFALSAGETIDGASDAAITGTTGASVNVTIDWPVE
ncbi:MAG TPA: FecR domain-containing protein [Spirochaetota bacterium]|nr:FecR domain-containing protein [Spirochaetota bacterium]